MGFIIRCLGFKMWCLAFRVWGFCFELRVLFKDWGLTDEHARVLVGHEQVEEVREALRLHRGHVDVPVDHRGVVRVLHHAVAPRGERRRQDLGGAGLSVQGLGFKV